MDLAAIFELPSNFDPHPAFSSTKRKLAEIRTSCLGWASELMNGPLAEPSVALTEYILESRRQDVSHGFSAVHRVILLSIALHLNRDALAQTLHPDALDRELPTLRSIARGDASKCTGPLGQYVADLHERMREFEGWAVNGACFEAALISLIDSFEQHRHAGGQPRPVTLGPLWETASLGGAIDLIVESVCIIKNDTTRDSSPAQVEVVSRLAAGVIGLAADLSCSMRGENSSAAKELVTQRLGVAARVIQLDATEIMRALRATTELEIRDLLDATRYLNPDQLRGQIVRRVVAGMLQYQDAATAVLDAMQWNHPSRAEVMRKMRKVADRDGYVSADEDALLRGMNRQLFAFQALANEIETERKVDFEEFERLRNTRMRVLDDLFRIALEDAQVTSDERALLLRALELIPTLRDSFSS